VGHRDGAWTAGGSPVAAFRVRCLRQLSLDSLITLSCIEDIETGRLQRELIATRKSVPRKLIGVHRDVSATLYSHSTQNLCVTASVTRITRYGWAFPHSCDVMQWDFILRSALGT
jgi:hypothetical protein